MPRRPPVHVHLLPALIPTSALNGGIAVVIDILRATTTMIHALAAGCEGIMPCGEIEEAREIAAKLPEGTALLAGERQGQPIEGFDLANSPRSCTPAICSGKTLVMTTTNGTRAILASLEADRVFVAAFVNRKATVEALKLDGRPVHLVCSGTDGLISLEDSIFAGALASDLDDWARKNGDDSAGSLTPELEGAGHSAESCLANDQSKIAVSLWRETQSIMDNGSSLASSLSQGRGGHRVIALGLQADLEDAATIDRFAFAAELIRDPLRIVPTTQESEPRLKLFGPT